MSFFDTDMTHLVGNYLYLCLAFAAIYAFPTAVRAIFETIRHFSIARQNDHSKAEVSAAWFAIMIGIYVAAHALSEMLYKSGRIIQVLQGQDTMGGATWLIASATFVGTMSLSAAIYFLHQHSQRWVWIYWLCQLVLGLVFWFW